MTQTKELHRLFYDLLYTTTFIFNASRQAESQDLQTEIPLFCGSIKPMAFEDICLEVHILPVFTDKTKENGRIAAPGGAALLFFSQKSSRSNIRIPKPQISITINTVIKTGTAPSDDFEFVRPLRQPCSGLFIRNTEEHERCRIWIFTFIKSEKHFGQTPGLKGVWLSGF